MNWLLGAVIFIIAVCVIVGYVRGAIRIAISLAATILTFAVTIFATPYISQAIMDYTSIDEKIQDACVSFVAGEAKSQAQDQAEQAGIDQNTLNQILEQAGISEEELEQQLKQTELSRNEQIQALEQANIPEFFKELLIKNNNQEVYDILQVSNFVDYVGKFIAKTAIQIVVFIVLLILITMITRIILYTLDIVSSLPVLGGLNRLLGAVIGLAFAYLIIEVIFLVIMLVSTAQGDGELLALIEGNPFLKYLYEHNYILELVSGFR